jgi:hypothetical protein
MQMNETPAHLVPQAVPARGQGYQTVDDVLNDASLNVLQKRAILSSWASDLWAIESCPWLREVPGVRSPLRVSEIFAALRALDDGDTPPRSVDIRPLDHGRRTTVPRLQPRLAELQHAG